MTPRPIAVLACLFLLTPLAAIPACSTAWKDHYRGTPAGAYAPTESVTVREVPWSRIDGALRAIEAERAASDTHHDEWTPEQLWAACGLPTTIVQIDDLHHGVRAEYIEVCVTRKPA